MHASKHLSNPRSRVTGKVLVTVQAKGLAQVQ